MQEFVPNSEAFIKEATRRALSNSTLGYIAISDITEAAKYSSMEEENNLNTGEYRGVKTFAMTPGDEIGIIVVPNGTIQEVYDNPGIGGDKKPLFSMATADSSDAFKPGQIAGVVNGGSIFVMEDLGIDAGSDADYNDIIFDLKGATPQVILLDDLIAENPDWRTSETGKELIGNVAPKTGAKLPEKTGDITSPTNPADTKSENSPTTESKNPTVSEIPDSATEAIQAKTETDVAVETQNPPVSETPNLATIQSEAKTETNPAFDSKNPTVSETSNSETIQSEVKTETSVVVETKNPTVSEIPNSTVELSETKTETSPTTESKNPTISKNPDSAADLTEAKPTTSPAVETKNSTVSETPNSATDLTETKTETSPKIETKNSTVSETPNSATDATEVKTETDLTAETQNSPVSETSNPATIQSEAKTETIPAVETQNPTVSSNSNSAADLTETKTETDLTAETQNSTVSEITNSATNSVETTTDKSPALAAENPTVAENLNAVTNAVKTKTENSPAGETQNPTVSENPNSAAINETEIDSITGETIATPVFLQPDKPETPATPADILTGEIADTYPTFTDSEETDSFTPENFGQLSPEEIAQMWENLNSIFAQQFPEIPPTISNEDYRQPASEDAEYIVENPTITPEIDATENYDSPRLENLFADSNTQPPTTAGEYLNPDIDSEISTGENSGQDNSPNTIAESETETETDSDFAITDTQIHQETTLDLPQKNQPFIGIIDTGFTATNPNINYSNIVLGKDVIDGDSNPLIQANQVKQHGDAILEIIGNSDNRSDTNKSPAIWLGRATGSGNWHQSLIEFVDAAIAAKQPKAAINLSFDLTQINPDGTQTTRHKLTAEETAALQYAKDNNILIVAAAGNEGNLISALGQASTKFDNIITVGAAENNYRAGYSSYGEGLDILAPTDITATAETPTTETKIGTSIAAAKVTNTISQMWAANPSLNYQQIKNILLNTAKDIDIPDWDERTGYGILNAESAIATAAETIPTIPVLAAAKILTKPLIDASPNIGNSPNSTAAKPSERATATTATAPGTPKITSTSTGDYNVGTSSYIRDVAPYKTTTTSSSNGTTNTNSRTLSSLANTQSSWDKSNTKTNYKGESFDESTNDSATNAATYTSRSFSQNSTENNNQWQETRSRVKHEGTRSDRGSSAQKSRGSYNYTTPTYVRNDASESYRNSKSKSNSQYGTNLSIYNGDRQDDWGSKSTIDTRSSSSNGNNTSTSTSKSATQTAGNAKWTNSSNGSSSNNTHTGEETTVNTSNSTSNNSSGFSKTSSNNDNYSVVNSTWDNTTTSGVAINSNTRDTYSESSSNTQSSYDDGKTKNTGDRNTFTANKSEQTNSSQGSSYRQNNRHNNYSVTQGNDTQTYKDGPHNNRRVTDSYSVTKSDGYSANSSGKVTSKNNTETFSQNNIQFDNEYKIDAYTTTSTGDEQTITSTRSNSNNDGTNNTSSSSSDTVRTRNGQTVTVYKDGRKDDTQTSSYERWWNDSNTDKGVTTSTSGSETWNSSYTRREFKGGYSWSETISGTNVESVTKAGTTTSKQTNWSWSRSGTVWDDGRNNWSESWSKSNWENGRSVPGESETARGSYDPKGTGTQTNNLPKAGEAPRLNKPPKDILELNKQPKYKPEQTKYLYDELPIAYKPDADKFSGDFFAGNPSPRKPTFKEQIKKLLESGAIANYNRIVDLIIKTNSLDDLRSVVGDVGMRTLIVEKFRQKPEMATAITAALLKGSQQWQQPQNDFSKHFWRDQRTTKDKNATPMSYTAKMNCWEMILYAAFLCGQITAEKLFQFIDNNYGGMVINAMPAMGYTETLPFYPNRGPAGKPTRTPQPGELVFFVTKGFFGNDVVGHVAISLGGSKLVSLWNQPNNIDKIQIIDVKDIEGTVQIGSPITTEMTKWKF
jgi:hypothetical protein